MMNQVLAAKTAVFPLHQKIRYRRVSTPVLLAGLVGDTVVVLLALALSSWLRFGTALAHYGVDANGIPWTDYLPNVVFGAILFILILPHRQLYELHRMLNLRRTVPLIIKAALTWFITCMALSWLLRYDRDISRMYVMVAFVVTTTLFVLWRLALYKIVSSESIAQRLRQRILFVGWSSAALSIAKAIMADRRHLYEIVGYVPTGRNLGPGRTGPFIRRLGTPERLPDVLQAHDIDMVLLADMNSTTGQTVALANLCEKEMIDFKVIPNCFQIFLSCLNLQTVSGVPVLGNAYIPLDVPFN